MNNPPLTLDHIIEMTRQNGAGWAVPHAHRLLELIKVIGVGIRFHFYIVELAAYLHDWGSFPSYIQPDVDHAVRSRQVVEAEILPRLDMMSVHKEILLEAIELHDYRDPRPTLSSEALLLREADMLEFLGMIGMAREFARGPNNVDACYRRILSRYRGIQGRFTIPRAQAIAETRIGRMEQCLKWLKEESFGVL